MKTKVAATGFFLLLVITGFSAVPLSLAADTSVSFKLANPADSAFSYTLNIIVPETLSDYYEGLSHRCASNADFPKFVTPYSFKPIADCLRQIYNEDEEFANAALTLVHQISYLETGPAYYPAETLVRNSGDCDLFAYVAASILKAGDIDVVLLRYESQEHMNIGVHLNSKPKQARTSVYSVESGGLTYYVGECTSSTWKDGWKVGECPDDLKNASAQIITLEHSEQVAPGEVSASFKKLQSSTLSMSLTTSLVIEGGTLTLQGLIAPVTSEKNVTLYLSANGSPWTVLDTTVTRTDGTYTFKWDADTSGFCSLRASWNGDDMYAGTSSETKSAIVIPYLFPLLSALVVLVLVAIVALWAVSRREKGDLRLEGEKLANS